jgi:acyl-coenzyme A synthetase/AMP-(fatty) acid ligase
LLEHPSIIQASVIGVQHGRLGEVVGAFLAHHPEKPRPTLDDIRSHVRAKLGAHKAPAHVFWLGDDGVVNALPVTGSGKVRKDQLRNIANALVKET